MKLRHLLFSLFFLPGAAIAQAEIEKSWEPQQALNVSVGRTFLCEARVGWENRSSETRSNCYELGLKFPVTNTFGSYSSTIGSGGELSLFTVTSGIHLGRGIKWQRGEKGKAYTKAVVYHDFNFYRHKQFEFDAGVNSACYDSDESMLQFRPGAKLLFGSSSQNDPRRKTRTYTEVYCGIGVQYLYRVKTIYSQTWESSELVSYDPPRKETSGSFLPTFHLGWILGLPVGRQNCPSE
ncbi:MAG: hypothetical protein R2751_14365 [Bacteroidales bacterium]